MKTSNRVITVRLSTDELERLNELCVRMNKTRSEVIREILLVKGLKVQEDSLHEEVRYIGNLLTALVRKANYHDAEAMIRKAYLVAREGKTIW